MIVVDASVLAPALLDDGKDGDRSRSRLRNDQVCAPDLIYPEVCSVFRRQARAGRADERRCALALRDLRDVPVRIAPHRPLLARAWELRASVTTYDALYVALAEALGCALLTADARLARSPGIRCACEVLGDE